MARLIAPNGGSVVVADERVESLVRYGFTEEKKSPAKKAASSEKKSEK